MNVLLFSTRSDPALEEVHQLALAQEPVEEVAVARSVEGLKRQLRSPTGQPDLAVLAVHRNRELAELLWMSQLLDPARIVLVLPTWDAATVALAHNLRPRFLAYADGDPAALMAVVMKMIEQSEPAYR
jgi:hypothetical protein